MKKILYLIILLLLFKNCYAINLGQGGNDFFGTVGSSNIQLENGTGFLIATNNAMAWDDVVLIPIIAQRSTGQGTLALVTVTGNIQAYAWSLNDYESVSGEFAHNWKLGTPISMHLHLLTKSKDGTNRDVKFTCEYAFIDINGVITAPQTVSVNYTIPANTAIDTHFYLELGTITPPLNVVSGHICARIQRIAAAGTAPSTDPILLTFGAHGYIDSLGSRKEYIK